MKTAVAVAFVVVLLGWQALRELASPKEQAANVGDFDLRDHYPTR